MLSVWATRRWPVYVLLLSLVLSGPSFPTTAAPTGEAVPPKLTLDQRARVEPMIWRDLAQAGEVSVLIHLAEAAFGNPHPPPPSPIKGEGEKAGRKRAVVQKLQAHAQATQAGVRALLGQAAAKQGARDIEPLWIVNAIAATVDHATLHRLAARDDVVAIRRNQIYRAEDLLPPSAVSRQPSAVSYWPSAIGHQLSAHVPWGLQRIGAERVWQELGLTGEGMTVATVDTGAQWTHPALRPSYLGNDGRHDYAWFDASGESPHAPIDQLGHGTHVLGTLVGDDGQTRTGVAPGSRWMAVRIFGSQGATDVIVHRAFQWLLAPTDTRGQNPDPSRAPDIVNHSWGHPNGANPSYAADVRRLREAGMVQVFAAGNEGRLGAGTIRTPGAFDTALAVGNTTPEDERNPSSSQGPAFGGQLKPDLSAPGTQILSTFPPNDFVLGDGTSLAAPHVAGTAALMLQANPLLSVADIERLLRLTAVDLGPPGPDPQFGAGRLDAFKAVTWARDAGQVTGRVVTAPAPDGFALPSGRHPSDHKSDGSGVILATVLRGVRQGDGLSFTSQVDSQGVYTVTVPSGVYTLTADAPGYATQGPVTVQVQAGARTAQDLTLAALPRFSVTGRVTDIGTGAGVQGATVTAVGTGFQATTDTAGRYQLDLPAATYTLETHAPRYRLERRPITVAAQAQTADFTLTGAPAVLLVDADAWATDLISPYYRRALDDAGFAHDTLVITDTRVFGAPNPRPTIQLPSLATLRAYDSVIWVHSYGSPGLLTRDLAGQHDAVGLLTAYLEGGGHLLLIGQDIGYLDGFSDRGRPAYAPDFYRDTLRASLVADVAGTRSAAGHRRTLFEGLTVQLSTPTGYRRPGLCGMNAGLCPDVIAAQAGATLVMNYSPLEGAALRTTVGPGRLVYLGFNLDGGARAEQAAVLDRALAWLHLPDLAYMVSHDRAAPGATLTYTATLTSNAMVATPGVTVTATVPGGLTVLPGSLTAGAVYDAQAKVVRWQGSLAPQASVHIRFQARMDMAAPGGITLGSEATLALGDTTDIRAANTRIDAPNLDHARLTVTPPILTAGGALTYTLTLTNTGSQPVQDAHLTAPLPDGTTLISDSLRGGATYNPNQRQIEWRGDIPAQASPPSYTWTDSRMPGGPAYAWYDLSATAGMTPTYVIQPAPGQDDVTFGPLDLGFDFPFYGRWRRQVWVADNGWLSPANAPNVLFEPLRLPCAGNPYCPIAPRPVVAPFWYDLTLTETGIIKVWTNRRDRAVITWEGVKSYNLEGPYTFQVVLNANGEVLFQYREMAQPVTLAGGGVQDDAGERGVQVYFQQPYLENGLAVRLTPVGSHPPPTLSYAVRLPSQVPATLSHTATLTDTQGWQMQLSVAAAQTPPTLSASTLAASAAIATPGSVVTYTLTLRNSGGVGEVRLSNALPDGVDLVAGSLTGGATYDALRREVAWAGTLGAGETRVIRYRARLPDAAPWTVVYNTARLDDGSQPVITLITQTELQTPDLTRAAKLVSASEAVSGAVLTYTVQVGNAGRAAADAVRVADSLPAGLSYVPGSVTGGATYDSSRNAITWAGAVPGRGAYHVEPAPYAWYDITTAGMPVSLPDRQDAVSDWIPLGFAFPFFGATVDHVRVSPNGWLSFGSASRAADPRPLPDASAPLSLVAPFWTDLQFITRGQIYYLAEPDRVTVTWQRAAGPVGDGEYTFQASLARDGTITFQYRTLDGDAVNQAVVGIQDEAGREGVTVAPAPVQRVTAGDAWRLRLPAMPGFTYRARVGDGLPLNTVITNTISISSGVEPSVGSAQPAESLPSGDLPAKASTQGEYPPSGDLPTKASTRGASASRLTHHLTRTATVRVNSLDLSGTTYSVTPSLVTVGERVEFRLTLRNSGALDAPNVTASLSLPDGLDPASITPLGGARVGSGYVTWAGRVPAQGSVAIGFSGLASTVGARLISEARVTPPPGSPRVPPRTVQADVRPAALTGSTLMLTPTTVNVGETVTATVVVQNAASLATQAALTLPLPQGVAYVPGSARSSLGATPIFDEDSRTIRWTGDVAAQSSVTQVIGLRVEQAENFTLRAMLAEAGGPAVILSANVYPSAYRLYGPMMLHGHSRHVPSESMDK